MIHSRKATLTTSIVINHCSYCRRFFKKTCIIYVGIINEILESSAIPAAYEAVAIFLYRSFSGSTFTKRAAACQILGEGLSSILAASASLIDLSAGISVIKLYHSPYQVA